MFEEFSDQGPRSQTATAFCVNIILFSPLMISLRAAPTIYTDDEVEDMEELQN